MMRLALALSACVACVPGTVTGSADAPSDEPVLEAIPGKHNDIAADGDRVLVVAYDRRYGDLVVADWGAPFAPIAGVPSGPIVGATDAYRRGVAAPGANVGHWCSVALAGGRGLVAYHDADDGVLRFAREDGAHWTLHPIDDGDGRTGLYASLSVDASGIPGVAYMVESSTGSELRWAQATTASPNSPADWRIEVIARAAASELPPDDMPQGIGLFASAAHLPDGRPVVAYYDRDNDSLHLATRDATGWTLAQVDVGAGQFASMAVGTDGTVHLAYRETRAGRLVYTAVPGATETVDARERVGGGAALALDASGAPVIAYQDEFNVVPLLARRGSGGWTRSALPGASTGFGFATSMARARDGMRVVTYGYDRAVYPPGALLFAEVAP